MNDDNVVTFLPKKIIDETSKPIMVLVCTECQCQTFYFYNDGNIKCANCDTDIRHDLCAEFVKCLDEIPSNDKKDDSKGVAVVAYSNAEFALASVVKKINEWHKADKIGFVATYDKEGHGKHWFDGNNTKENISSLERLLEYVRKTVF